MTFKVGDKVKATEAFVGEFSDVLGAKTGLQSVGTVESTTGLYLEVRLDNGYHVGQANGTWFFLPEELELQEAHPLPN